VEALLERSAEPSAIWDVHEFLSKKLRVLERKYDYRYSVLAGVFGRLLSEGWLTDADFAGLSPQKLELIHRIAGTAKELDAPHRER
jgi:photoprotection regulator FRP-like protein